MGVVDRRVLARAAGAEVVAEVVEIFWPFEYQRRFVRDGWALNEAYVLRAFLQFNARFEITYFADFVAQCHPELVPPAMRDVSSLWLHVKSAHN